MQVCYAQKAAEHRNHPTPPQYEAVRIAAEEEGVTITAYCRDAIMEKADPQPDDPRRRRTPGLAGLLPAIRHQRQDPPRYAA